MTNPLTFLRSVRSEIIRVIWPSRNETLVTTVMVVILTILASIFFFLADQVLNWVVTAILSIRA